MAEVLPPDWRRCSYFFLYDGSKVRGEGDATRTGICCFHPEKTPLDKQELICGQLAGAVRCVSELSSAPVRTLRLRRNQFAIRMRDDFLWALGCSVDVPAVSVSELLDQLIDLFCFYSGSVRHAYQLIGQEQLSARWSRYLSHLQAGSSELHQVFSCIRTIDAANVDPLLLLKAALILQACQRCPLVAAGCILFRGRVVSTQMSPRLTMKVMVHESESYAETPSPLGPSCSSWFGGSVSSTTVYLTSAELQHLRSAPVDADLSSVSTPQRTSSVKTRLSRTLSDTPSDAGSSHSSSFKPRPEEEEEEEVLEESCYHSFHTHSEADGDASPLASQGAETPPPWPLLLPMALYVHRVKGLVLTLLVEPHFLSDTASMEEVYHSSLASLNGLEAHLRTAPPGAPGPPGPYVFAHFDCIQSTMTTNLSGGPGAAAERPFVRATSLLHSHFCSTETLQEAIIRSAGAAVYGTRSVAQETYFQQHGGSLRNSGIPNYQDSAFSLPGKARHRLLKHGVNLL